MTKSIFPNMKVKDIDIINQRKDNPKKEDKLLNAAFEALMPQYPNTMMNRRNHRKVNHNPVMSMVQGFQLGGVPGVQANFAHDMEDMFSDFLVRNYGTMGRNMFEIGYNALYSAEAKRKRVSKLRNI